jgi:hypothetical protein
VFLVSTLVGLFPLLPGNVGVFQLAVASVLAASFGVEAGAGAAFGVGLQAVEVLLGVGVGAVFLVADEGNSTILALHDRLYAGPLAGELRLDLPYVPHITVGRFSSAAAAKACADRLNAGPVTIRGRIEAIAVVRAEGGRAEVVATFPLRP